MSESERTGEATGTRGSEVPAAGAAPETPDGFPLPDGRVLIDGRALQDRSSTRGIGTYVRGLLGGLAGAGAAGLIDLALRAGGPEPAEMKALGLRAGPRIPVLKRRLQPVADPFLVALRLRRGGYALYHAVEWAQPVASRVPVVLTVHDLIPFLFPRDYPWMRRERLLALRLVRRADAVITPSEATRQDVVHLAGADPDRVTAVHHGMDPAFRPLSEAAVSAVRARHGIEGDYVLAVGVFDPRKRLDVLLEAAGALHRERRLALVIAGDQGAYTATVGEGLRRSGVEGRALGFVSREDLIALYSGARCMLFTSAYEGFGLPVLEAMACGCPVAAFANSAIPEVVGGAAVLADDGDATALGRAAARLVEDGPERERLVALGLRRAAGFTWGRCAEQTLAVYRRVCA